MCERWNTSFTDRNAFLNQQAIYVCIRFKLPVNERISELCGSACNIASSRVCGIAARHLLLAGSTIWFIEHNDLWGTVENRK